MSHATNIEFESECNECRHLEVENAKLKKEKDIIRNWLVSAELENAELKKENERLREAMDRILYELNRDEPNLTLAYFIVKEALNPK